MAHEALWFAGEPAHEAFLVDEGVVTIESASGHLAPFQSGAFLGEFDALRQGGALATTARVTAPGRVFQIHREDLLRFFQENPGVQVSFLGTKFIE